MAIQNFKLMSEFQTIHRRPFEMATPAILDPTNIRAVVDGEFFTQDTAYKMVRGGDNNAGTPDIGIVPAFVYAAQKGQTDVQAIQKAPFLYLNSYEADTLIFLGTSLAQGSPLMVRDVDIGGIIRRGLGLATTGAFIVGYVSRLPANNNNFLRFFTEGAGGLF